MSDIINSVEKTCSAIRKLNFPIYKIELAAAAEITDMNNNKETVSFSCRKKIGLLWIVLGVTLFIAMLAVRFAKKR
ncbi:MAG: hypothetical protein IJF74_03725 [Clostridia bacterium]|nr:hypothetical protein [Clostridia bacterium]